MYPQSGWCGLTCSQDREKWWDSGFILKVHSEGIAGGGNEGYEGEETGTEQGRTSRLPGPLSPRTARFELHPGGYSCFSTRITSEPRCP